MEYTKLKNFPVLVWINREVTKDPLTIVATYIIKSEASDEIIQSLEGKYDFAYTMTGEIFKTTILLEKIEEIRGKQNV